jgi:lipopolysaccharide/colanic/teichoic acid biosynthesis glycosyltransferase
MYSVVDSDKTMEDQGCTGPINVMARLNRRLKRLFDIVLALMGLLIALPLMGIIILLIRLESPGPFIFSQERLGQHGRRFRMHKFRKFPADYGNGGSGVTVACDVRMTRIGALLERLKFDELPQLWNILKGEMSFVGPRPESTRFADLFSGRYAAVLEFKPGIFGPCQVAFRNECEMYPPEENPEAFYRRALFPRKVEMDLAYFQRANILTDLLWIMRGLWVSLCGAVDWPRLVRLYGRIILIDVLIATTAWTLAHFLRFSGLPPGCEAFRSGLWMIPLFLVIGMFSGGCYSRPPQFFSLEDASRITVVITMSLLGCFLLLLGLHRSMSLYLMPICWFILFPSLCLPRVLIREQWKKVQCARSSCEVKVLLYGAGKRGVALADWVGSKAVIGFLDDNSNLRGRRVCGHRILGRESDLPTIREMYSFDQLWLTFQPNVLKERRLRNICEKLNVKMFIIPALRPFSSLSATQKQSSPLCTHGLSRTKVVGLNSSSSVEHDHLETPSL